MFEKSLYDLIRGLRSHKGNEAEYIQSALKECRTEIRSQDMDVKATALLKLIYLEMFGHDMSWASFNVLEVMSSNKHIQKRVGYLAAVQSFRADTEVLMLATNLLKKDITSPSIPILSLPLITLPHIITSSLALSLLSDLLPRLSHSQPAVRKKTVVTLYRLALVYPETLRVAWPKIKERLMDENENSSVTAAVVNVVCELGWRRPHDFLPLAPRLFDLLIERGNNWMAIKIIKLFTILTPLEPRLVKKLVRPLTNLIQNTSAMSLLYECISGIIQGGILGGQDGGLEGDAVANLCISKLRGMILVEGDPNLKYVALLAFNKIVISHPVLVSMQQDVIMDCLDDPDISIRLQALELVSGMVSSDNLQPVVSRLLKQLRNSPIITNEAESQIPTAKPIKPAADSDGEDPEEKLTPDKRSNEIPPLPNDYRREVITRILDMCSHSTYANITDFEWYLDVLVQMVRLVPPVVLTPLALPDENSPAADEGDVAYRIGLQILDIAVRVKSLRSEATKAAESLVLISNRESLFPSTGAGADGCRQPVAWVVGEFAEFLTSPREVLSSLIHQVAFSLPAHTLSIYVQAIPKIFAHISVQASRRWDSLERSNISLLLVRIIDFFEQLAAHPSLDVQERCVEFLELFRVANEALNSQEKEDLEAPLLLTSAIPSLFSGWELNPVAVDAQKRVPLTEDLDLNVPINANLSNLLHMSENFSADDMGHDEFRAFYHERAIFPGEKATFSTPLDAEVEEPTSYQAPENPSELAKRKAQRRARNKDDPFYIQQEGDSSGRSTPLHEIFSRSNGTELDLDAIPIVDLKIDSSEGNASSVVAEFERQKKKGKIAKNVVIAADETIGDGEASSTDSSRVRNFDPNNASTGKRTLKSQRNLLQVDSSALRQLSLEGDDDGFQFDVQRREAEEAEMAAAIKEVERLRLQMQRAAETVEAAEGVDDEGTIVKRKKKRRPKVDISADGNVPTLGDEPQTGEGTVKKKKKKKKRAVEVVEGD